MNALILSCNTGEGHNSCARAIQEVFELHGEDCVIEDSLGYISPALSGFVSWGHVFLYRRLPRLFGWGYSRSEKHTGIYQNGSPLYSLLTSGAKKLAETIDASYDIVICTHVFSGMLLTEALKLCASHPVTAFVGTDYTCSPMTEASRLDAYFIPAPELKDEFAARGVDGARIVASGLPVRSDFYIRTPKARAKAVEGIADTHSHLLVMCGSMGCGPIEQLTDEIAERLGPDEEMTIVCGTNRKLFLHLEEKHRKHENVHIRGYVNNISLLMDSADLYLTKPGGISVSEARVKELPMAFVNAVAGCEAYNLRFFTERGAALYEENTEKLAAACIALLQDPERLARMSAAMGYTPGENAAESIFRFMSEAAENRGA